MNASITSDPPRRHVVIVDPSFADYANVAESETDQPPSITLTNTAAGALRLAPSHCDAIWLVNAELPDMGGLELTLPGSKKLNHWNANVTTIGRESTVHFTLPAHLTNYRMISPMKTDQEKMNC